MSATANGTIAMTAKVSGVPDLLLYLGCPGGIADTVSLPAFHPCVRLNRWKSRPGELSFVPPDGRFILAGYEVDLLGPAALDAFSTSTKPSAAPKLTIPATASILTSLGPAGADFEVHLALNPRFMGKAHGSPLPSATRTSFPRTGGLGTVGGATFGGGAPQGTTAAPSIEEMVVHVPLPASVKNVADLRVKVGDAGYAPGNGSIEWRLSSREIGMLMSHDRGAGLGTTATLRGTVIGMEEDDGLEGGPVSLVHTADPYDYEEDTISSYQASSKPLPQKKREDTEAKRIKQNKVLMPSCVTVSFTVKGWLPSGIKVESLNIDAKRSKGLGAGVTPYKGVKYLAVSRKGVEGRC